MELPPVERNSRPFAPGRSAQLRSHYISTPSGLVRIKSGGHGKPSVVFVSGVGDGLQCWNTVLARTSELTHAMAFDRLGLGRSASTNAERDAGQISSELCQLLTALKEPEPVLLVAHSAGAFHARMFAHRFAEKVAALLLVEPSHEDWLDELMRADAKAWLKHMQWRRNARHSPGRKRELAALDAVVEQMRRIGPVLPPVPVTIISATAGHAAATDVLFRLHRHWLSQLPHARHVVAAQSGHYVQNDAPEIVVGAILDLLEIHSPNSHS